MLQSPDFRSLLNAMERHEARYLVVGGYAVMLYAEPRFTKDLDLWIAVDDENARAVYRALKEFGAPLAGLTERDFAVPGHFYQMGRPPLRVDVMMGIPGGNFADAWERRNTVDLDGQSVHFVCRDDLIAVKRAAGRDQDLLDVASLLADSTANESE